MVVLLGGLRMTLIQWQTYEKVFSPRLPAVLAAMHATITLL